MQRVKYDNFEYVLFQPGNPIYVNITVELRSLCRIPHFFITLGDEYDFELVSIFLPEILEFSHKRVREKYGTKFGKSSRVTISPEPSFYVGVRSEEKYRNRN